jgi:hypothetical protein
VLELAQTCARRGSSSGRTEDKLVHYTYQQKVINNYTNRSTMIMIPVTNASLPR